MNKTQLQTINNLSTFIFDSTREYNRFMRFIMENRYKDCKMLLDNVVERLLLDIAYTEHNDVFVAQYKKADELLHFVIDLEKSSSVAYGERRQDRTLVTG